MKNREIKFRFWNHIVGRMTEKSYTLEELYKEKVNFTNLIPLQFTGLHDKNGVEIYEGDVVKTIDSEDEVIIGSIFWNVCCWSFANEDTTISFLQMTKPEALEVIGNIYQTVNSEIGKDGGR